MPEYLESAVLECIVNGLIHRDYMILGSEVHIDIFDDRMEIYSPGGMMDGSLVQNLDTDNISSKRRNPVIADVFSRMNYMERRGSGFKKIKSAISLILTSFNLTYSAAINSPDNTLSRQITATNDSYFWA